MQYLFFYTIILIDKNGLSRGAAFIRLNSNQEAINAVNALNGTKLNGRIIYAKVCIMIIF